MQPVTMTDPAWVMDRERIEARMPPHPRGVVELLRRAGHEVAVREKARNTGLPYKLNDERWRSAFELKNRARMLGVLWPWPVNSSASPHKAWTRAWAWDARSSSA
jgi:hypothetical protein